jgi:hypothetical protein
MEGPKNLQQQEMAKDLFYLFLFQRYGPLNEKGLYKQISNSKSWLLLLKGRFGALFISPDQ